MTGLRIRNGWLALALALGAAWARSDEPPPTVFPAESKATAARIDDVRKLLADHKWPEAVEQIQAALTASGDDLVPLGPARSVSCRRLCHALLASLPPDALRSYRNGADPQAKKWLDQGAATRDARLLRRVADEAFCSRAGERAIDLLGDMAFERGGFAEAESWWRLLLPPSAPKDDKNPPVSLFYPDPQIDAARTRAKVLLARLFAGAPGWDDDLAAYRKDCGAAEGALAGKAGRYADILAQVAPERRADPVAPTAEWATFGGDASRGLVAAGPARLLDRLGALCRPANERQFSLKDRQPLDLDPVYDRGAGPLLANRSMAFEPVIADGKAIVADAQYVTAYDLHTGAVDKWYDAARANVGVRPDLNLPAPPDLRYTLTVAGDRLFVRLGTQTVRDVPPMEKGKDDASLLVCLSLRPKANGSHFLWSIDASAPDFGERGYAAFEGSPAARDGLLYIASTRFVNGRPLTRIHCYPADSQDRPEELWHQDVCETHEFAERDRRCRQHLLMLAGPYLVYCSHSGAVVALDALTGKPVWAVRYPSRGDKTADNDPSPRDLAPCLFAAGRLYFAPADYDRLLCLDPASGETLWSRGPLEVVHLLGVGEGRLIFTTPTGLRALGADDGVDAWALPDGGGALPPAGRGLLIDDVVLWPTTSKGPGSVVVQAVRQRDGVVSGDPTRLRYIPAGNLVYADGCLLSADRQVLTLFSPPRYRLEELEKESRADPDSPTAALALARAEADAGLTDRAAESFPRAERLTAALPASTRKRLMETIRKERHEMLLDAGRRAAALKHWDEAGDFFKRATAAEFSPPLRLQALLETAALWKDAGQPDRAAAIWQAILGTDDFRNLTVEDGNGVPRSATAFAAQQMGTVPAGGRRKPADAVHQPAHAGRPPFFRTWEAALDPGETALAVAGDLLLCGRGQASGRLTARSTEDGKLRWQTDLPFAPTWAGKGGVIVTAGEGGAAGIRAEDGQILWQFPAPPPSRTFPSAAGTVLAGDGRRPDPLADFLLLGNQLHCLQGERRLFALDAATGEVLWARRAPGAGLRQAYPAGRFWHVFAASDNVLVVQTSGGRRWLLDGATGRLLRDTPTTGEPWPREPVRLPTGDVLLTTDSHTVVLLDPSSGREVWTWNVPGVTTRTGEAPRLAVGPNAVVAGWEMNIGWQVQRLDAATGTPLWDDPPLLNVADLDLDGWSLDADAFYGVQDRAFFARSLKDGSVLWQQPSAGPEGRWQTRRVGDMLLAYPIQPRGARIQFRWWFGALQWVGTLAREDASGLGFPILCCDAKTGRLGQRINLAVVPRSWARLDGDGACVLPWLEARPLDEGEGRPLVSLTAHGLLVALAGRAWGLSAAK